jgi:hypothetical protein
VGRDSLTVSDRGLRHGLLDERFGHDRARPAQTAEHTDRRVEVEGTT